MSPTPIGDASRHPKVLPAAKRSMSDPKCRKNKLWATLAQGSVLNNGPNGRHPRHVSQMSLGMTLCLAIGGTVVQPLRVPVPRHCRKPMKTCASGVPWPQGDAVHDRHACIRVFQFCSVSRQTETRTRDNKGGTSPGVLWGAERETLHRGPKLGCCDPT